MPLPPRLVSVFALAAVVGCAGPSAPSGPGPGAEGPVRDLWFGLDGSEDVLARASAVEVCSGPWGTWFEHFGVRGLACVAAQVVDPSALVALAPVEPFESGPHVATGSRVALDLSAERAFGHYDPAFVEWAADALVPDADALRSAYRPIYDRHASRLARVYWLTHRDLVADGFPGDLAEPLFVDYANFLDGGPLPADARGPEGGYSMFGFTDRGERLLPELGLPPVTNGWEVKYEAATAYGFWLRRAADGTHDLWHDGLRDLLAAFDAEWLAAHSG